MFTRRGFRGLALAGLLTAGLGAQTPADEFGQPQQSGPACAPAPAAPQKVPQKKRSAVEAMKTGAEAGAALGALTGYKKGVLVGTIAGGVAGLLLERAEAKHAAAEADAANAGQQ